MSVKFSLTGERRRLESNYNSTERVFLTLTLAYFARVAVGHDTSGPGGVGQGLIN
jgi:hypothetical protein